MSADIDYRAASDESLGLLARYGRTPDICRAARAELDRRRPPLSLDDLLLGIARKHCHAEIETLETRRSDRLDFHEVSVWGLRAALRAAYSLGVASAAPARPATRFCDFEDCTCDGEHRRGAMWLCEAHAQDHDGLEAEGDEYPFATLDSREVPPAEEDE